MRYKFSTSYPIVSHFFTSATFVFYLLLSLGQNPIFLCSTSRTLSIVYGSHYHHLNFMGNLPLHYITNKIFRICISCTKSISMVIMWVHIIELNMLVQTCCYSMHTWILIYVKLPACVRLGTQVNRTLQCTTYYPVLIRIDRLNKCTLCCFFSLFQPFFSPCRQWSNHVADNGSTIMEPLL